MDPASASAPAASSRESSPYSELLGITTLRAEPGQVVCRMEVPPRLTNRNGVLHGGALMSVIDHAAGSLAFENCPEGRTTVTVEAKTNFLRPVREGEAVTVTATPVHVGRTTMVIQLIAAREDGKELSATMQTHMFVEWAGPGSGTSAGSVD